MPLRSPGGFAAVALSALLAALLLAPPVVTAFPVSPKTLWELTRDAELVVLARVEKASVLSQEELGEAASRALPGLVALEVLEIWKGRAEGRVPVIHQPHLICPSPARYVEGETVLAFLGHVDEDPSPLYRTVALSYGSLYPEAEDVPLFRRLVRRAVALQRARRVSPEARRDWLVTAASHRATRWHGLFELVPDVDRLHAGYDVEGREGGVGELSSEELQRIAAGFVAEPSVDVTLPMTLTVLAGHPDRRLDEAFLAAVEARMKGFEVPRWLPGAVMQVLRRYGEDDPGRHLAGVDLDGWQIRASALRAAWERARQALAIPKVEPVSVPGPRVPGTGADTR